MVGVGVAVVVGVVVAVVVRVGVAVVVVVGVAVGVGVGVGVAVVVVVGVAVVVVVAVAMTRHPFGWDLPPGCTPRDIEDAVGDAPETCESCGYEDCDDAKMCAVVVERDRLREQLRVAREALELIGSPLSCGADWHMAAIKTARDALAKMGMKIK